MHIIQLKRVPGVQTLQRPLKSTGRPKPWTDIDAKKEREEGKNCNEEGVEGAAATDNTSLISLPGPNETLSDATVA